MMITWLDRAAAATMAGFVNGIWIGVLLAGAGWLLIRWLEDWRPLNATTRFSVWISLFVLSTGLVCWQGGSYAMENNDSAQLPGIEHAPMEAAPVELQPPEISTTAPVRAGMEVEETPASVNPDVPVAYAPAPHREAAGAASTEAEIMVQPRVAFQLPARIEISALDAFWRILLFAVWITVVGMLLLRVATGWYGVRRLKKNSYPAPTRIQRILDTLLDRIDAPRGVRLGLSDEIQTAAALGLWRPTILLPASMPGLLSNAELEQVLLHETAHLQRYDDWTMLFQRITLAFLFFHPGLLLLARMMDRDREFACDDWVLALTRRPKAYASCLAKLVAQHVQMKPPAVVPGFSSKKEELFDRVKTILDKNRTISFSLSRLSYALILAALTGLLVLTVAVAPVIALPENESPAPARIVEEVPGESPAAEAPHPNARGDDAVAKTIDNNNTLPVSSTATRTPAPPRNEVFVVAEVSAPPPEAGPDASGNADATAVSGGNGAGIQLQVSETLDRLSSFEYQTGYNSDAAPDALPWPRATARQTPAAEAGGDSSISSRSMVRLLKAAGRIPSSGDKAQVLIKAAGAKKFDPAVFAAYLETVQKISSSGDKSRTLLALLNDQELDAASAVKFFQVVASIPSSSDKSSLLLRSLNERTMPLTDEAVRRAFLDAVEKVASPGDYRRVMEAFLRHAG